MPKIILDPCIEDELWAIWCFIALDNPEAATRLVDAAYETFKTLAANPGMGRRRQFRGPRLRDVRSWRISGFENYLIFYRGVAGGIQVHHVYHGARDVEERELICAVEICNIIDRTLRNFAEISQIIHVKANFPCRDVLFCELFARKSDSVYCMTER